MKVFTWGTFDLLHEGHMTFLQEVSKFGEVFVIVIPDVNVFQNKGNLPIFSEIERVDNIRKTGIAKKVYLDCLDKGLKSFINENPDYFALGYDQKTSHESNLKQIIKREKLKTKIIRMDIYANGIHSSNIRRRCNL